MAEVSREQQAETRQDPCKMHRLLGRRVKQDCEMKLHLFSILSLPLSICLSLPFSLSLCLFSLCKPSAANFHPTHLRINSNTSLSLCQDILLANLPHPLAMWAFYSTDCLPDNSQTWWFALTSLCMQSAHVTEGLQRMQGTSSVAGQPCSSSVRLRHRGLAGRRDRGFNKLPLPLATSSLHLDPAPQTPE